MEEQRLFEWFRDRYKVKHAHANTPDDRSEKTKIHTSRRSDCVYARDVYTYVYNLQRIES